MPLQLGSSQDVKSQHLFAQLSHGAIRVKCVRDADDGAEIRMIHVVPLFVFNVGS